MKSRRTNLGGLRFGKWTVGEFSHINSSRSAYWQVICDCGKSATVSAQSLKKVQSTQCRDCSRKDKTAIYNSGNKLKFLYVFKINEYYKIGVTDNPSARYNQFNRNSPYLVEVILIASNRVDLEKELHTQFKAKQIKGEWFKLDVYDIQNLQKTLACSSGSCEMG